MLDKPIRILCKGCEYEKGGDTCIKKSPGNFTPHNYPRACPLNERELSIIPGDIVLVHIINDSSFCEEFGSPFEAFVISLPDNSDYGEHYWTFLVEKVNSFKSRDVAILVPQTACIVQKAVALYGNDREGDDK